MATPQITILATRGTPGILPLILLLMFQQRRQFLTEARIERTPQVKAIIDRTPLTEASIERTFLGGGQS